MLVVSLSVFLLQCVDYDVLFNNKNITASGQPIIGKRRIGDAVVPQCPSHFSGLTVLAILMAIVFWFAHLLRVGYRLLQLYEIQTFYRTVLEIKDADLTSIPWKDVVQRICKRQPHVHLIVSSSQVNKQYFIINHLDCVDEMSQYPNENPRERNLHVSKMSAIVFLYFRSLHWTSTNGF